MLWKLSDGPVTLSRWALGWGLALLMLPLAQPSFGENPRLLIHGVTANATEIAFAQGGVLWVVPRAGGEARALVTDPEILDVALPQYSPDGRWIAYSMDNQRNFDAYVVAAQGGEPRRLTYHPKLDLVRGWSPQGEVLFTSNRDMDGKWRLYAVAADPTDASGGVFPRDLPLPLGYDGAYSPDGRQLAYVPISGLVEFRQYRHYRGGGNAQLWLANLADSAVEVLAGGETNHRHPMWIGDRLCFTGDETGTAELYCRDLASGATRQHTQGHGFDIRHAAAATSGDAIVFTRGGRIHLFDLARGTVTEVPVTLPAERPSELGAKTVAAIEYLVTAEPSPDGSRLALEARGDVLVVGFEDGATSSTSTTTVVTQSSDAADRSPVWSPDGQRLAYFSDASGEYQLVVRDLGTGGERGIAIEAEPTYYYQPVWSPDGQRIAFTGERLDLWIADVTAGTVERVDRSDDLAQELYDPSWSVDGRYLAYSKGFPNHRRSIVVLDTETGERRVISGQVHATQPVFDRNGQYLHYLASNNAAPAVANEVWSLQSARMFGPLVLRAVHTVLLHDEGAPPFLPFQDEPNPAAQAATVRPHGALDLAALEGRTVRLPLPERDTTDLVAGAPGVLYLRHLKYPEAPGGRGTIWPPLHRVRLAVSSAVEEVAEDVDEFRISADGSTAFYRNRKGLFRRALHPEAGAGTGEDEGAMGEPVAVDLSAVAVTVDPAVEFRQIYREAWRMMREFFYDPHHHGQDLEALSAHFAEYLPHVLRREDLNFLLGEMLGEVSISHMSIGGGDRPAPKAARERIGTLGAEFEIHEGRYRVTRVYRAAPAYDTSSLARSAPLDQPGAQVREGEVLLAVNGEPLTAERNLFAQLDGTAYRPTVLTVGPHGDGRDSRTVTVVPVGGDNTIKTMDFFERNRQWVEEHGQGRVAYVAIPDFGPGSLFEVYRQLAAQQDREALILDGRFGLGGVTADALIGLLASPALHQYAFPHGAPLKVPTLRFGGPKVLLINEQNASASETFPLMFKIAQLGTLVGKRTVGAGTGTAMAYPRLIDGGRVRIPNRASYNPLTGEWAENAGIAPDVEVEWWPADWRAGRDPQLEKALEIALEQAAAQSPTVERHPRYPVHPRSSGSEER
jgi:tricorn protease